MMQGLRSARSGAGLLLGLFLLLCTPLGAVAENQAGSAASSSGNAPAVPAPPTLDGQTAGSTATRTSEYMQLLQQIFRSVENNYVDKPDPKTLFEGAMKGLFDTLHDPHSYYLPQSLVKDFTDTTSGRFGGVGLIISKPTAASAGSNPATGSRGTPGNNAEPASRLPDSGGPSFVEVVSPIHGSPAYRAGISAGDLITKIDGKPTVPMTIDEVVNLLRGAPGTSVDVTISRKGDITFTVKLERAIIEVPVVTDAMIPPTIGYIRIIEYTPLTPRKVRDAVESLKRQGATALIIDERGNPGGLLSAVVTTSDYFLSHGVIVSTRSRIPSENEIYTANQQTLLPSSFPVIVLIDKGSASAAEIFAGALKDHHRALIVGETSFGKGSVQQVYYLPSGYGAFKLTTAKYYTPNGKNIDKIGIRPDVVVSQPTLSKKEQEDLKRLIEENIITNFVRKNPHADGATIDAFVAKLHGDGISLDDYALKRLVRSQQDRMQNNPPVYDLTYDRVLQEAVKLLKSGRYPGKKE